MIKMKKAPIFSLIFFSLVFLAVSCTKDNDRDIFTFSFENPSAMGKVYIQDDGLPVWHSPDTLRVNTDDNLPIHYTQEGVAYIGTDEIPTGNHYPYVAVFGHNSGCQVSGNVVTGWADVASEYDYCYAETFGGTNLLKEKVYAPMMGYIPNEAAGNNFSMKNLCGILRFSLKASTTEYLVVQSINVSSQGGDIAGRVTCTWNTTDNQPASVQLSTEEGHHSNMIQVDGLKRPVAPDFTTVCNIPIAPVSGAKLTITITCSSPSGYVTFTREQNGNIFSIARNELITLQSDLDNGGWTRNESACTYLPQAATHYFSVDTATYIEFSSGNLQYSPLNRVYRFAPHQYDFIGAANANVSATYAGWIDLFGFHGGDNASYATDNIITDDAADNNHYKGTLIDYIYTCANGWRVPTGNELTRIISDSRMSGSWPLAWVRGRITEGGQVLVNGLILFPDNFVCPEGITLTRNTNGYTENTLTLSTWATLEQAGCVFLPAGGYRKGQSVYEYENGIPYGARYGSCTHQSNNVNSANVTYLIFNKNSCNTEASNKFIGRSIRLVRYCLATNSSK